MADYSRQGRSLISGLIKLRDLPDDLWNADTLFVLSETWKQARELARIAEDEEWAGDIYVYADQDEIDRALGTGRIEYMGLLSHLRGVRMVRPRQSRAPSLRRSVKYDERSVIPRVVPPGSPKNVVPSLTVENYVKTIALSSPRATLPTTLSRPASWPRL